MEYNNTNFDVECLSTCDSEQDMNYV